MFDNLDTDLSGDSSHDDDYEANDARTEEDEGFVPDSLQAPRLSVFFRGHEDVESEILSYWHSGKMPHALIFSGQKGIGKATMAFRLARFVLKTGKDSAADSGPGLFGEDLPAKKPDTLAIDPEDPVFSRIASGGHADLMVIERPVDERSGNRKSSIPVDTVRKINPFLHRTASEGGWRVVIVDDADRMNRSGQNAILKILEEPPEKTLLILVAHKVGTLLPTIRSRCRIVSFHSLAADVFSDIIKAEYPDLYKPDIATLYSIAEGSVGKGIQIMEEGGLDTIENILGLLKSWPQWDWPKIHSLADTVSRKGQEKNLQTFQNIFVWITETFVRRRARDETLPEILSDESTMSLYTNYSLAQWIEICDNLKAHYNKADWANLDKRQAVIDTFTTFDNLEKAA